MTAGQSRVSRAASSVLWTYAGRGIGLAWTVMLIAHLGVAGYGRYAFAFAIAAAAAVLLDYPFIIASARGADHDFAAHRSARIWLGTALAVIGTALALAGAPVTAWFAVTVVGGEIGFNALKSQDFRDGSPQAVSRTDTVRRLAAAGLGAGYLLASDTPDLGTVCAAYCLPYIAIILAAIVRFGRVAPRVPGPYRRTCLLLLEAVPAVVTAQADVIGVGLLTDDATTGYYAVVALVGWSAVAFGQAFATTFFSEMRAGAGAEIATRRDLIMTSFGPGLAVAVVGVGLLVANQEFMFAIAMIIMAVFTTATCWASVPTAELYVSGRDVERLRTMIASSTLKVGAIVVLVGVWDLGAVGAAMSASAAALLALVLVNRLVRKPQPDGDRGTA